jgi:hypothetical protein
MEHLFFKIVHCAAGEGTQGLEAALAHPVQHHIVEGVAGASPISMNSRWSNNANLSFPNGTTNTHEHYQVTNQIF